MYRDRDTLYIVMEYVPGISLGMVWPSLAEANKHSIVGQLRCIFDQMRALPSPGFYGSVNRGPVPHRYFYSREKTLPLPALFRRKKNSEKPSHFAQKLCGANQVLTAFTPTILLATSHQHFAIIRLRSPTEISSERMSSSERSSILSMKKSMK